jgi:molybdopterin-binding protein
MLSIADIVENLPAHVVYTSSNSTKIQVTDIVAGDLMSDILVSVNADYLLVTSLATEQAIRTADISCACAVLLVNDKLPTPQMKKLAQESDITLLATPLPMYDACVSLANLHYFSNMSAPESSL